MTTLAQPQDRPVTADFEAIKAKQKVAWSTGDYPAVGVTLQSVGERLIGALELQAGERVLDVAGGNGNAALAAARRFADVTCTDYVSRWLEHGQARAAVEGLTVHFQEADVEALPFADDSFAVVASTFGVMFAPDQPRAAAQMMRVLREGGRIGLASWTPESFIGALFRTLGQYVPPAAGLSSPALWGTPGHLRALFPAARSIEVETLTFNLCYPSAEHWVGLWREVYGPLQKAFDALTSIRAAALQADLIELIEHFNVATDGTMNVPSAYLQAVITK